MKYNPEWIWKNRITGIIFKLEEHGIITTDEMEMLLTPALCDAYTKEKVEAFRGRIEESGGEMGKK